MKTETRYQLSEWPENAFLQAVLVLISCIEFCGKTMAGVMICSVILWLSLLLLRLNSYSFMLSGADLIVSCHSASSFSVTLLCSPRCSLFCHLRCRRHSSQFLRHHRCNSSQVLLENDRRAPRRKFVYSLLLLILSRDIALNPGPASV